ncbi:MAG: Uma2 family endonuclease [Acidobacteriota bacterium]|nr:Uma2 family endonuclease [Acidobacteriota bacterium]
MTMEALLENLRYFEDDFEAGLPTMDDLPSEYPEDSLLPDIVHPTQSNLLKECLLMEFQSRGLIDFLIAAELNIHFDKNNPNWHKRPDWFLALGTSPVFNKMRRRSYLIWQEKVRPYLVLEILSKGTEKEDLGKTESREAVPTKWQVYEKILQVPYYVCFDHHEGEIRAYRWEADGYVQLVVPKKGLWLEEIQLGLRLWQGRYQDQIGNWLRFYDGNGKLLPTEAEAKLQERAEKERLRAILKAAGIDPDQG